jgi:double-stranded uracil-DNA glycosylase
MSGAAVFVVPNPSGRNRAYPGFAAKLRWDKELAETFGRAP